MTATIETRTRGPSSRLGKPGASRRLGVAALAVGLVVAALGVRAAVVSDRYGRDLADYAQAQATALWIQDRSGTVSRSMSRLMALDAADVALNRKMVDASVAQDVATFNALAAGANVGTSQQEVLHSLLLEFGDELADAVSG